MLIFNILGLFHNFAEQRYNNIAQGAHICALIFIYPPF